jgi:hypothetical protein
VIQKRRGPYRCETAAISTLRFASVIEVGTWPERVPGGFVVGVSVGTP